MTPPAKHSLDDDGQRAPSRNQARDENRKPHPMEAEAKHTAGRRMSPKQMRDMCDRFNAYHRVGDVITIYMGAFGENPQQTSITYPAQILGGHTAVVYTGRGSIALSHVARATGAAQ